MSQFYTFDAQHRVRLILNIYNSYDNATNLNFIVDTGASHSVISKNVFRDFKNKSSIISKFEDVCKDDELLNIKYKLDRNGNRVSYLSKGERQYLSSCTDPHVGVGYNGAISFMDDIDLSLLTFMDYSLLNVKMFTLDNTSNILGMDILKYFHIGVDCFNKTFILTKKKGWESLRDDNEGPSNINLVNETDNIKGF